MIQRPLYIQQLLQYLDVPLVKILAGIRRSGKSTILEMLRDTLVEAGRQEDHIIAVRYTDMSYDQVTARGMYDDLAARLKDDARYYLLLDEVQEVDGWEKVLNSLLESKNVDLYVTGSNSRLMAGEISTYLTGRYVLIPVYTLSFAEYLDFRKDSALPVRAHLNSYLRYGGFPIVALGNYDERSAYQIVEGIYASVVQQDIARRHRIANQELFNRVVLYVLENVGKTFSANAIVKFLKSEGRPLTVETIYNYLQWLEEAFIVYRCPRYDLQGKAVLKTQEKYYLADQSLKYGILGFNPKSIAAMMENIVYFELRRRGYEVFIGKNEAKEIDFVAVRRDERCYVQVCRMLPEDSDREIANLLEIPDNHPKYVVTLDEMMTGNVRGVKIIALENFLLLNEY